MSEIDVGSIEDGKARLAPIEPTLSRPRSPGVFGG